MDNASVPLSGAVAAGFEPLREAFAANFEAGLEVGASLCVIRQGAVVVDLWGGFTDPQRTVLWHPDQLINVYSTTKGIAALAFAMLVEDGVLNYEQPVAHFWPELRAGNSGLSIGDLLAHKGGVCGVDVPLEVADLYDWEKMIRLLEAQQPYWKPGSGAGYHAVVWGYLPGELALRTTGRTLGELLQERLAQPLAADFYLGLDAAEDSRVAPLIGPNRAQLAGSAAADDTAEFRPGPLYPVALQNPGIRPYQDAFSIPWRRAELAASNGHASARGVAAIYASAAAMPSDRQSGLLSNETRRALLQPRTEKDLDQVLNQRIRRGAGVILNRDGMFGASRSAFGHPGAGGSLGFADPERGIGFGYVMNQMLTGEYGRVRGQRLLAALDACLPPSG